MSLFTQGKIKNNNHIIYFVTGVSGVGKTTVMSYLKELLPKNCEVHDFDERGVPNNAGHKWRLEETRYWIGLGSNKVEQDLNLVVCGFVNPDEIIDMNKEHPDLEIQVILLDGDSNIIERRLRKRNEDPNVMADLERATGSAEDFITNNTRFVSIFRKICKKHNCPSVDTSKLTPEDVAKKVASIIQQ